MWERKGRAADDVLCRAVTVYITYKCHSIPGGKARGMLYIYLTLESELNLKFKTMANCQQIEAAIVYEIPPYLDMHVWKSEYF